MTSPPLPPPPQDTELLTFGCRLNSYESQVMRTHAQEAGLTDTVIVNTCAVTGEAVRQARQAIRRTARKKPGARIIVTGCAAQIDPASFAQMDEVAGVLGNEEKLNPESFSILKKKPFPKKSCTPVRKTRVGDIMRVTRTTLHPVHAMEGRARAFVQVQTGCDHRCTFCIIPFGRGNSRSVPADSVVRQVQTLVDNGYQEVVLTGVDIVSYGCDLPGQPGLGDLSRRILEQVPALARLRLSSLDPVGVDATLLRLIGEEARLMPHLHLSLQAGDNMILKRMKRRHSREHVIRFCQTVRERRPDTVFGADIIAGFPTETEDMFRHSLDLVDECSLTWLHVFPYSARPGTPAARMPQVAGETIKTRASKLREAGKRRAAAWLASQKEKELSVLMEKPAQGRTEHFAPVHFEQEQKPGTLVRAHITGASPTALQAAALTSSRTLRSSGISA